VVNCPRPHPPSLPRFRSFSLNHSLAHSLTHSLPFTDSLAHSPQSGTHPLTHSNSPPASLSLSRSRSLSLSLPLCLSLRPSLSPSPYSTQADEGFFSNPKTDLERAKEEADIRKAIDDLSTQLTFVLIQDHMDESLVMLRRLFCWDMDDIIYAALKVSGGSRSEKTSKPAIPQEVRDAIDKHIWADK
jgi:hypothetical protein